MDDNMEDEIICELLSAHVHLIWKYLSVTSSRLSDLLQPGPADKYKSKMSQLAPLLLVLFVIILANFYLQSGSDWLQNSFYNLRNSFTFSVSDHGLKNFVSAAISTDAVSQELQDGVVGVYAMQGRRATMEDRYSVEQNVPVSDNKKISFFGVYDGHGGQYVAEYVKRNLLTNTVDKIRELQKLKKGGKDLHRNGIKANGPQQAAANRRRSSAAVAASVKIERTRPAPNSECIEGKDEPNEASSGESSIITTTTATTTTTGTANTSGEKHSNAESGTCHAASSSASSTLTVGSSASSCNAATIKKPSPSPNRKSNSDESVPSTKEKDEPLKQREDPYSTVPSRKRNGITPTVDNAKAKENDTLNEFDDFMYIDSQHNINYTRLLTDQLAVMDNKLVEHCKKKMDLSGTTAVIAILDGDLLIIGNVGDSRAVMADINGGTIPLSFDHKPNQLKEKKRIQEAGGFVSFTGVWRVAGVLATSRAIGDFPLKDPMKLVTAEPDVLTFSLKDHKAHFVILATDGLWDVLTNEEAVSFVKDHIHERDYGARSIVQHAYDRGSQDNITVAIINITKLVF